MVYAYRKDLQSTLYVVEKKKAQKAPPKKNRQRIPAVVYNPFRKMNCLDIFGCPVPMPVRVRLANDQPTPGSIQNVVAVLFHLFFPPVGYNGTRGSHEDPSSEWRVLFPHISSTLSCGATPVLFCLPLHLMAFSSMASGWSCFYVFLVITGHASPVEETSAREKSGNVKRVSDLFCAAFAVQVGRDDCVFLSLLHTFRYSHAF